MTRLLVDGGDKVVACRREAGMRRKRAWHYWWLWFQKKNEREKGQLV
jgi:hypothetical protein